MNYAELKQIVKSHIRENTTELDALLDLHINVSLRKFCRMASWPQLRIDDESITTTASTQTYVAPYPIERLINDSVRYDVTSAQAGYIIPITGGNETQLYRASTASTTTPQSVTLGRGDALFDVAIGGTVSLSNRGLTVTGVGTGFTSAMVGKWIVFHSVGATSNDAVSGDYGYKIGTYISGTEIWLSTRYRGPTIAASRYSVEPLNCYHLRFDPLFTEGGKVIKYSWQRKPARLYNEEDMPEVDCLSEAVAWDAASKLLFYHNNMDGAQAAAQMSRTEFVRAKSTLLS